MAGSIIGQKPANEGGVNQQPYDEEGKFASKDANGLSQYNVRTTLDTDDKIIEALENNGSLSAKQKATLMRLPPKKRQEVISKIRDRMQEAAEQAEEKRTFELLDDKAYKALQIRSLHQVIEKNPNDYNEMLMTFYGGYYDGIHLKYRGGGDPCFEFLKAWRFGGFDEYWKFADSIPNYPHRSAGPKDKAIFEQQKDQLKRLAESCTTPIDMAADRFLDTNWIVSFMGKEFCSQIGPIVKDEYGYNNFDKTVTIKDIYEALKKKIEETPRIMRKPDDAVSSVSCTMSSHMAAKKKADGKEMYKPINVTYDIPAGSNIFVSTYEYESECLLKPGQQMFIKAIDLVPVQLDDGSMADRILLRVGLVR